MQEIKDPSNYFYCRNGQVLKNINELFEFIITIDDDTFSYHFNQEKNDFANWVGDTLKMEELSREMYLAKTREDLYGVLEEEVEKPYDEMKKEIVVSEIEKSGGMI